MSDQKIVPIHYSLLIRVFEHDGFSIRRRKGDHVIMTKRGINRPLVLKQGLNRCQLLTSELI